MTQQRQLHNIDEATAYTVTFSAFGLAVLRFLSHFQDSVAIGTLARLVFEMVGCDELFDFS
jgi:hypothetical protein